MKRFGIITFWVVVTPIAAFGIGWILVGALKAFALG